MSVDPDQLAYALLTIREQAADDDEADLAAQELLAELGGGGDEALSAAHAPAGGVTVQGTPYAGGEFIPGDVMERATPEEKAAVEGKAPAQAEGEGTPAAQWKQRDQAREKKRAALDGAYAALKDQGAYLEASLALTRLHGADVQWGDDPARHAQLIGAMRAAATMATKEAAGYAGRALDRLREAGVPAEQAEAARQKYGAAVEKRAAAYTAGLDRAEGTLAALAEWKKSEPPEPAFPEEPPEPRGDEKASEAWQEAHAANEEKYEAAREKWQEKYDRWQEKYERLDERSSAAVEKLDEAHGKLDEALDAFTEKLDAAVEQAADKGWEALEAEEAADPEPQEAEGEGEEDAPP